MRRQKYPVQLDQEQRERLQQLIRGTSAGESSPVPFPFERCRHPRTRRGPAGIIPARWQAVARSGLAANRNQMR